MESCAALKPPPSSTPTPPSTEIHPYARKFSDFVAVIVQPGDSFSSLASEYLKDPSLDWFISGFNEITSLKPGQELIIPLQPYEKGGLTFQRYQTVPVIVYHKFSKNRADRMTVKENAFESQMRFLRDNGYRVIPLEDFFSFLDFKRQIPKKSVVITIDEEWHSTYEIAFPVLKKYGYPATFFAYTDFITPKGWDLIKEMSRSGIDVQCHAKTHRNLIKRKVNEPFREYFEAIKKELTEATQIINKQLNKEVKYLAYPYGDTNPLTIALLKKLGYRGAFTVERGSTPFFAHPYRINRSMIYGEFNLPDFERNLSYFSDRALQ
ncbi:MAG: polysaccharide deacetylase family protein [Thermodesulfobacteriota bacterium]